MADKIIVFRGKPEECAKCAGMPYCAVKSQEGCPIRPLPNADTSGAEDQYSQGWDDAVSSTLYFPKICGRDFGIPVESMDCCLVCATGMTVKPHDCPFKRFFSSEWGDCDCVSKEYFLGMRDSLDRGGCPEYADYASGFRDGFDWIMEQLGLNDKKKEETGYA